MKRDYHYQNKTFRDARRILMAPHPRGDNEDFAAAFHEVSLGLRQLDESGLDDDARRDIERVRTAMDTTRVETGGDGAWLSKIRQTTTEDKREFSDAVDRLATWFHDAFNKAHPD